MFSCRLYAAAASQRWGATRCHSKRSDTGDKTQCSVKRAAGVRGVPNSLTTRRLSNNATRAWLFGRTLACRSQIKITGLVLKDYETIAMKMASRARAVGKLV